MAETLQFVGFGAPRLANVADIEAELATLWRSAAGDPDTQHAVTRACALTLLVYVENRAAEAELSRIVSEITLQNPCRVVVMIAEAATKPAGMEAWVSAHCHLPVAGEKQVCCEQVTIWARGQSVADLDNVVVPLTVPGLPVCLWWRAGRFDLPPYFANILRVADRVIVDSARFANPDEDLAALARHVRERAGNLAFSDLNWTRGSAWRELVAQCFDTPEPRSYLDQLAEVRFECTPVSNDWGRAGAQGLLFAGWLASRLHWRFVGGERVGTAGSIIHFMAGSNPVRIYLGTGGEGTQAGPGHLSIVLKAHEGSPATFSLTTQADGRSVRIHSAIPGRTTLERVVRLLAPGESELVNEELRWPGSERVFEQALAVTERMIG